MDTYFTSNGVRGVVCGDWDGDGWDDILTTNRLTGNISIFKNNGDATFTESNMDISGQDETACALVDINNDGILDIYYAAFNSQKLGALMGDGNGGFNILPNTVSVDGRPWMIAAGDLNGDGFADVVSVNSNDNSTAVAFGDGTGALSQPVHYSPPDHYFPLAVDLGDLDGDGDLDIVTSNYSSDSYTVFKNDGTVYLFMPLPWPPRPLLPVPYCMTGTMTATLTYRPRTRKMMWFYYLKIPIPYLMMSMKLLLEKI